MLGLPAVEATYAQCSSAVCMAYMKGKHRVRVLISGNMNNWVKFSRELKLL